MNYWKRYKKYKETKKLMGNAIIDGFLPSSVYMKYRHDYDFKGLKVLNLGCGKAVFKAPNVTNLDYSPTNPDYLDVNHDLSKMPLPFEDNSFDMIIANHVMEHIPNWFECMKEMARVVRYDGFIEIWVPPVSSDSAFTYRDHINYIGFNSFAGCKTMGRPGTNLNAADLFRTVGHFKDLECFNFKQRPIFNFFTAVIAPDWILDFMSKYLRNTVSEVGYFFSKVRS